MENADKAAESRKQVPKKCFKELGIICHSIKSSQHHALHGAQCHLNVLYPWWPVLFQPCCKVLLLSKL